MQEQKSGEKGQQQMQAEQPKEAPLPKRPDVSGGDAGLGSTAQDAAEFWDDPKIGPTGW